MGTPDCKGPSRRHVSVCAEDRDKAPGGGGHREGAKPAGNGKGKGKGGGCKQRCRYEKLDPQPPKDSVNGDGHSPDEGAVYRVTCTNPTRVGTIFVPNGSEPPAEQINPEAVARRAVDSMRLDGPDVASPRSDRRYVLGMPMWMWVRQSPTTWGPNTASATAGSVTVTAKVTSIRWDMGDGTTVTCTGPGTPYDTSEGKAESPDCGHRYTKPSSTQKDGKRCRRGWL